MRLTLLAVLGLAVGLAGRAEAGLIVTHNPGGSGEFDYYGQSVTTPGGGPFHDISFLVFPRSPTPVFPVTGTLFILTQEFLGQPGALNSATAGYLASTSTSSGREWSFDPSVTLDGDTQYFFYTNAQIDFRVTSTDYTGGTGYQPLGGANFQRADYDTNFQLSGTAATAVPEPSTLALAGLGAVGPIGAILRRRRA